MRAKLGPGIRASDIRAEVESFLSDDLHEVATEEEVDTVRRLPTPITIRADSGGLSPETLDVIVEFAPLGARILTYLWTDHIVPRIRKKYGRDAIRTDNDKSE